MEKIRLQKYISESGFCSRRKAEQFIMQNRVKINNVNAIIGSKVNPLKDIITVDGERIIKSRKKDYKYIILNKPRGYVTTMKDEKGRKCVADLISDIDSRVYPVGRLDVNSEGLIILTNDGGFANDLMHPSRHVSKKYRVTIRPDITDEQAAKLSSGIEIDGRKTAPAQVYIISKQTNRVVLEIVIKEGRNRQIRKMCEALNLEVARLKRVSIGPIKLGMLKPGTYRNFSKDELRAIRTAIKRPSKIN